MQSQVATTYQLMDKVIVLNILKELIVIYKNVRQLVVKVIIMYKIIVKFVQQDAKTIISNKLINKNNVLHNAQQYLLVNYVSKEIVLDYHNYKLQKQIDEQHNDNQHTADTERRLILTVLHLEIKLNRQRSAGLHCLVSELCDIFRKGARELRQKSCTSRRKEKRRRLTHDSPHGKDHAGQYARHRRGQKDRPDHIPLCRSHSQRAAAIAVRHGAKRLLRVSDDQRQHHQRQCQCAVEQRIAKSEHVSEENHAEQSEDD